MKTLSMDDLYVLVRDKKLGAKDLILDVRSPEEFQEGHIQGALNISHHDVADNADKLKNYEHVYVHCKMGPRAQVATSLLEGAGLKNVVCVANGGMYHWIASGYPTAK